MHAHVGKHSVAQDAAESTLMDQRCEYVVAPVKAEIQGQQKAHDNLIEEYNESLNHMEAVACECCWS